MRGPTLSASVMAATTNGWLIVCPNEIGSAVFSQARSAKGPATKRSRSTAPTAASTFSSAMPDWRSSAIRRCMAGTFIAPAPLLRLLELGGELAPARLVFFFERYRRHRDEAAAHGGDVGLLVVLVLARRVADPVVGAAARVDAFDDVAAEAAHALARDPHALDGGRCYVGKVDVDEHVLGPPHGQHLAHHVGAVMRGGRPLHRLAVHVGLAEGDRRDSEQAAFHGAGNGTRVGDVVGEVGAAIDARQNDIGLAVLHEMLDAEQHAVAGRALEREFPLAHVAQTQRLARSEE